ncbi:Os01g0233600 [Oryza sativa Japonica Group]|uniref:Os01g0233600 protein n=1 Tax=Oryza sativa subsp. japonica TaxID=39947 RepID=A0A0P0V030_ORYSJ|nr:Os01g0233600 [Oryza sativa Japonica Group]
MGLAGSGLGRWRRQWLDDGNDNDSGTSVYPLPLPRWIWLKLDNCGEEARRWQRLKIRRGPAHWDHLTISDEVRASK